MVGVWWRTASRRRTTKKTSVGESTTVSVLNSNGGPEVSPAAQRIVQVIADDLK